MMKNPKHLSKLLLIILIITACSKKEPSMQDVLRKNAEEQFYVTDNIYLSSERAAYFDSISKRVPDNQKDRYILRKAEALLYGGKTKEAIIILDALLEKSKKGALRYTLDSHEELFIGPLLALAYIRLGEQENCLHHHDATGSCIIPINPKGYHHAQEGSRKAIMLYEDFLSRNNHDYNSLWLLNIAYMTLGEYPSEVPEKWRIPDSVFDSEYPLKKFIDIAPKLGLNVNELSGGGIIDDFNNDNLLDVMVSSWFITQHLRYFINNGDGSFTEKTETAGLLETGGGLNLVHADYNNDGFIDVFVLRGGWMEHIGKQPNSLLKNNGDNTFTDVTLEAGLLSFHPTQTAVWADFNNDGWVDLFIGNESNQDSVHPCEFYINNGDGTFSNNAISAGLTISDADDFYYVKGVTAADFNNDGWVDIYVSSLYSTQKNLLFINKGVNDQGILKFDEVGSSVGLEEKLSTFPTWAFDYNNDGWTDIFVAGFERSTKTIIPDVVNEYLNKPHHAETMRLYRNDNGTFTNVSDEVGLNRIGYAMGANYGDLDNDGYPDIYLSTGAPDFQSIIPNRVFRNNSGETFQDVTTAGGFGNIQKGHGVSFSDIDNDGDQDIHVVMGGAYEGDTFFNSLYINPYQDENNWVTFILEGTKANRSAIGSKLEVTVLEDGQERKIFHTISSGGSFGCSTLRAEIGLGKASELVQLKVTWAGSGTQQVFEKIKMNTFYRIVEENPQLKEINLQPFIK